MPLYSCKHKRKNFHCVVTNIRCIQRIHFLCGLSRCKSQHHSIRGIFIHLDNLFCTFGAVFLVQLLDMHPEGLHIEHGLIIGAEVTTALVSQALHHSDDFHLVAQLVGLPSVCAVHVVTLAALCCVRREGGVIVVVVVLQLPAKSASPSECTAERDLAIWV